MRGSVRKSTNDTYMALDFSCSSGEAMEDVLARVPGESIDFIGTAWGRGIFSLTT